MGALAEMVNAAISLKVNPETGKEEYGYLGEVWVIADYLADFCSNKKEFLLYWNKLKIPDNPKEIETHPQKIPAQTLLDVIAKFGDPKERKAIQRIQRMAIRMRKKCIWNPPKIENVKSIEDRRKFNKYIRRKGGDNHPHPIKKKTIYRALKRPVSSNMLPMRHEWWLFAQIKKLMATLSECKQQVA